MRTHMKRAIVSLLGVALFASLVMPGVLADEGNDSNGTEAATLADVPAADRTALEDEAAALVRDGLARAFPGRELHVERDGGVYKIFGNLSL